MVYTFTTDILFNSVRIMSWEIFNASRYVTVSALLLVPVFTYIATLRYRLYDIDVVTNRALVYGSLTAMLVAVYFGGVAATEAIFRAFTGPEEQPQLAIVVSPL
jgi:hypothetical protein